MEVILLQKMANLGPMGKIVKVKNGYARNYLLPMKKALRANEKNKAIFESQRSILEAKNLEKKIQFEEMATILEKKDFFLIRSAGETGNLYGSVSSRDIADLLAEEGFQINRGQIDLRSPIKSIGTHNITILLHADVSTKITVSIARSSEEIIQKEKTLEKAEADTKAEAESEAEEVNS
ncbi:50S ribosomal protein L9 [Candidatus Liberibacter africanus]|uniref:50S ribosomal protein L9 n=1 Tax=Liberibacter africanus TaxID=34020 RepID=UPI001AE6169E|nr:50S ribosomal protein L9 [Candidatus Liberibacter africanus]QTP63747.1 50S ribosomal protein L9 [Candidatus Liberibacter africanus]